jgi:hypothetical protein
LSGIGQPPHFLNLHNSSGIAWPIAENSRFDIRALHACLAQHEEWKRRHGFPLEVGEILEPEPGPPPSAATMHPSPAWQRIIIDRPEQILAVLVQTGAPEHGQLVGLVVRQDGWVLQSSTPLFTLGSDWPQVFPDLTREPSPEAWRRAWQAWCEPRSIPAEETQACILEPSAGRLRIAVPPRLMARLRATRSDVLKGEAWLLAGEGRVRTAALVEVIEPATGLPQC